MRDSRINRFLRWLALLIYPGDSCDLGEHDYGDWQTEDKFGKRVYIGDWKRMAWRRCERCGHRQMQGRNERDQRTLVVDNFVPREVSAELSSTSDDDDDSGLSPDHQVWDFGGFTVHGSDEPPFYKNYMRHGRNFLVVGPGGFDRPVSAESHEEALQKVVLDRLEARVNRRAEFRERCEDWGAPTYRVYEVASGMRFDSVKPNGATPDWVEYSDYVMPERLADPMKMFTHSPELLEGNLDQIR